MGLNIIDMYRAQKDSPSTYLMGDIGTTDTNMLVGSADVLPKAVPFPLTLGFDKSFTETVMVTEVGAGNNQLTIERGPSPLTWVAGTKCARVFTSVDLDTIQKNIEEITPQVDLNTADLISQDIRITQNTQGLETEISRSIQSELTITTNLTNEITRSTNADTTSHNAIIAERDRSIARENELEANKVARSELTVVITNAEFVGDATSVKATFTTYDADAQVVAEFDRILPIASDSAMGLMTPEAYKEITQLRADVKTLQQTGGLFIGQSFATYADLEAFEIPETVNKGDFTYVLKDENHDDAVTLHLFDGTVFVFAYILEPTPIGIATTDKEGLVKSATIGSLGKIYVEIDGTMSLLGWDSIVSDVSKIVSANDTLIKFQLNGNDVDSFTLNQSTPKTINFEMSGGGGMTTLGALLGVYVGADMEVPAGFTDMTTWVSIEENETYFNALAASPTTLSYIYNNLFSYVITDSMLMAVIVNDANIMLFIAADASSMNAIVTSDAALIAISESTVALNGIINSELALDIVVNSANAMETLAESTHAMTIWANSSIATIASAASTTTMNILAASTTAMNILAASTTAMNILAASTTAMNILAASTAAMNILAASTTAMNILAASTTAMNILAASTNVMNILAASTTAMNILAASTTAMNRLAASTNAMNILAASTAAMNILAASSVSAPIVITSAANQILIVGSVNSMNEMSYMSAGRSAMTANTAFMVRVAASSMATAKYACGYASPMQEPHDFADITTVVTSTVAMTAVAASTAAMTAVAASTVAMAAVVTSTVAMTAVAASTAAMTAVALNGISLRKITYSAYAYMISLSSYNNATFVTNVINTSRASIGITQVRMDEWYQNHVRNTYGDTHDPATGAWRANVANPWTMTPARGIYAFRTLQTGANPGVIQNINAVISSRIDSIAQRTPGGTIHTPFVINKVIFGLFNINNPSMISYINPTEAANSVVGNVFSVTVL